MRHRAAALGGSLQVTAGAVGGTIVTARFPLRGLLAIEVDPAHSA
jgi:signal transduction histidine kinase